MERAPFKSEVPGADQSTQGCWKLDRGLARATQVSAPCCAHAVSRLCIELIHSFSSLYTRARERPERASCLFACPHQNPSPFSPAQPPLRQLDRAAAMSLRPSVMLNACRMWQLRAAASSPGASANARSACRAFASQGNCDARPSISPRWDCAAASSYLVLSLQVPWMPLRLPPPCPAVGSTSAATHGIPWMRRPLCTTRCTQHRSSLQGTASPWWVWPCDRSAADNRGAPACPWLVPAVDAQRVSTSKPGM